MHVECIWISIASSLEQFFCETFTLDGDEIIDFDECMTIRNASKGCIEIKVTLTCVAYRLTSGGESRDKEGKALYSQHFNGKISL